MIYECEVCKSAPKTGKWPRPYQWKTPRGFENHSCYAEILERQEKDRQRAEKQAKQRNEALSVFQEWLDLGLSLKPGDVIHYVTYYVTKPTHEQRGSRTVKVRYEEERRYIAVSEKVLSIQLPRGVSTEEVLQAIRDKAPLPVCYRTQKGSVFPSSLYSTFEVAQAEAAQHQAAYDAAVDRARSYR